MKANRPTLDPTQPRIEDLRDDLQCLAECVGVEETIRICREFPGARLNVPKRWHEELDLNVLGREMAQKLCKLFGPERLEIPKQPFSSHGLKRLARALLAAGASNNKVALTLRIHYRTVSEYSLYEKGDNQSVDANRRRLVLQLAGEGLSHREISLQLGMPVTWVRNVARQPKPATASTRQPETV